MNKNPFYIQEGSPYHKLMEKRRFREKLFKNSGLAAVLLAFVFLAILFYSIFSKGFSAFELTKIKLNVEFSKELIDPQNTNQKDVIANADYAPLIRNALDKKFPEVAERSEKMQLYSLFSNNASAELAKMAAGNTSLIGSTAEIWLTASTTVDMYKKGKIDEHSDQIADKLKWLQPLTQEGAVKKTFNSYFFTEADSREPEQAGVLGSIIGSIFTIVTCMLLAFPLGVMTAIYLEEFAPKNRLTDFIEVNINNLAAVPSIVFGLLGLSIYISIFGWPRSSPVVGGLTLALLILPVIVITTRNSIKSIPPSVKDAATALGASKMQVTMHHVVPLAMPGIMTGTILGIARALGETAPLLMIGMVAFVADIPAGATSPATTLPVQIFLWADSPEIGFAEKTSAAIIVLLLFLIAANALAVYLRKKFEVKW